MNSHHLFIPLINIRNKKMKSWTHTGSLPSLNKTKYIKHVISAGPKQEFLLHITTIHPPTIKALQTRKIKKLGSLFSPH